MVNHKKKQQQQKLTLTWPSIRMKLLFKVVEATLVMVLASSRWWFIRLGSISSGWTGSGIASSWFVEVLQIVIIIMMIIGSVIVGRMCQYLYLYRVFHYKKWNSVILKKSSENETSIIIVHMVSNELLWWKIFHEQENPNFCYWTPCTTYGPMYRKVHIYFC